MQKQILKNNSEIEKVYQINPKGSKWFYHSDSLGSTSLITDEEDNVIEDNWYLSYGLPMIDSNEKKLSEGMEYSHDIGEYNYKENLNNCEKIYKKVVS